MLKDIKTSGKLKNYEMMADLFTRPHYIELKYKLAMMYKKHTLQLVSALEKLDP